MIPQLDSNERNVAAAPLGKIVFELCCDYNDRKWSVGESSESVSVYRADSSGSDSHYEGDYTDLLTAMSANPYMTLVAAGAVIDSIVPLSALPLKADFGAHQWMDGFTITHNGAEADFFEVMGLGSSDLLWSIAHDLGVVECWLLGQHTLHRAFDLPDVVTDLGEIPHNLSAVAASSYAANDVWPGGEHGDFEVRSDFLEP